MTDGDHRLPRAWLEPVRPETYPGFHDRRVKPVTRADLDNQFQTVALRGFGYDRSPAEPPHRFRLVNLSETLDLYTRDHDFGRVVWPMWQFLFADNWRDAIDALADRKLFLFDIWGYCPSGPFERFEWSEYRVTDVMHAYILEKLGPRFLGYDNGEQDGRYIGGYARLICPAPTTRAEGLAAFQQYFDRLSEDLHGFLVSLNSLTFPHYFAERGDHRLLGAETAQALPSVPVWYAFVRGAGKQHGLLWFGNASVWNRWGAKSLADPDAPDTSAPGFLSGPTAGTSLGLLRRLWYLLTMYGSVMMGFEAGHLANATEERPDGHGGLRKIPKLTEIGREHMTGAAWRHRHPDLGEIHTPVALLWDHDAGWAPPRHLYTSDTYLVWGNMSYEKGDHQIDLLFRELFPGYEDSGFFHDERGFLTPTPCGDQFDVLLSDVSEEVLDRYAAVVVLGQTRVEGDLLTKLDRFIKRGGHVVASADQLGPDAGRVFGAAIGGGEEAAHAVVPGHPWPINEPPFRMSRLAPLAGSKTLAATRQGAPLAVRRDDPNGGGTLVFAAENMLSNPVLAPDKLVNEVDAPLASPFRMLQHVRTILLPFLRSFGLVEIEGPPVQYLVNLTARTDRLVVTLVNNDLEPWLGTIRPRRGRIRTARDLLNERGIRSGGTLRLSVPPRDVAIVELLLDRPAFEARA